MCDTISRGDNSVLGQLRRAGIDPDEYSKYLTHDLTICLRRSP